MENKKNLPVLNIIPKWKMRISVPGKKRKLYYIPELDKYVDSTHVIYELIGIHKTPQEHYDRWYLNVLVPSDRPRIPDGRLARFRDYCFGYAKTQVEESRSISFSEFSKLFQDSKIKWKSNSSKGQLRRYRNPDERKKTSRSSRKVWSNPTEALLNNSLGSYSRAKKLKVYSKWENKDIILDSSWEIKLIEKMTLILSVSSLIRPRFSIKYTSTDMELHNYIPDFLLNDHYLIEIKPNYLLDDEVNIAKFNAADIYCRENGLEYVILTEDYLFSNDEPFYGSMPF